MPRVESNYRKSQIKKKKRKKTFTKNYQPLNKIVISLVNKFTQIKFNLHLFNQ